MIKCLISDVDGTLLLHKEEFIMNIEDKTVVAVRKLVQQGVHFVLASGRTHANKHVFEKQLGFPLDFIGSNGSSVIINEQLTVDKTMPLDFYIRLVDKVSKQNILSNIMFVDSDGHHIFDKRFGWDESLFLKMNDNKELSHYFEGTIEEWKNKSPNSKLFNKAVLTIANAIDRDELMAFLEEFVKEENIDMFYSGDIFIEIMPKAINKASGIANLCEYYGFNLDEVAVIGDSFNDVSMFTQHYQHSFVMQDADPEVKAHAKHVVASVDEAVHYIMEHNLRK
jgi:Cof subfamily protein (haloacid dehalogenase superfamily)